MIDDFWNAQSTITAFSWESGTSCCECGMLVTFEAPNVPESVSKYRSINFTVILDIERVIEVNLSWGNKQ